MSDLSYTTLERGIIAVSGKDRVRFLQGLITNDIHKATDDNVIYTCLLTPQGKFLFDFFIVSQDGMYLLDCAASQVQALMQKLNMYKLRSDITIEDKSASYSVFSGFGQNIFDTIGIQASRGKILHLEEGIAFVDPRVEQLGVRWILPNGTVPSLAEKKFSENTLEEYELLRISLGVPDGTSDLVSEKSFPLQYKMEEMHAIDFEKGCYVGQEVTARSKHRGNIRKTLFTVQSDQILPPPGTVVTFEEKEIGELRSSVKTLGLALLSIEVVKKNKDKSFLARDISLTVVYSDK